MKQLPDAVFGYALIAPAMMLTLVLLAYPLVYSLWVSLHEVTFTGQAWIWVGLENYRSVFADPLFWPSTRRTLQFALTVTVFTVVIGLGFALLLTEEFRGRDFLRGLLILPWSLSQIMLALTFGWIFNSQYGPLNGLLFDLGIISDYVAWFANGQVVFNVIALSVVWNLVPLATILLLASLQTVPEQLYNAARMDGANSVQRFFMVTLPWIRETLLVVVTLAALNGFLVFGPIYILTGGGPGTDTTLLSWWGYEAGFAELDLGESAAIYYCMTVLIVMVAYLTNVALRREATR
jgi:ABC-type sugar transport system permease subunit